MVSVTVDEPEMAFVTGMVQRGYSYTYNVFLEVVGVASEYATVHYQVGE